jgi:hypothetical protein
MTEETTEGAIQWHVMTVDSLRFVGPMVDRDLLAEACLGAGFGPIARAFRAFRKGGCRT